MYKNTHFNRKTVILICLILFQVFIVFENGMVGYMWQNLSDAPPTETMRTTVLVSLVAGVLIGFTAIYLIIEILRFSRKEHELEISQALLDENAALVDVLRSNRHDIFNHLQVILGYIQLEKSDMAVHYIREITGKLDGQTSISNIKDMGIAALLLKKESLAEKYGFKLGINIETDLSNLNIPSSDLTRILGNLLDNAFDAVSILPNEPSVNVSIWKDRKKLKFAVSNVEPLIPPEAIGRVFDKGFTSKGEAGSGLGLYIVRELAEKYGGTVELISDEEQGTVFTVTLPSQ